MYFPITGSPGIPELVDKLALSQDTISRQAQQLEELQLAIASTKDSLAESVQRVSELQSEVATTDSELKAMRKLKSASVRPWWHPLCFRILHVFIEVSIHIHINISINISISMSISE